MSYSTDKISYLTNFNINLYLSLKKKYYIDLLQQYNYLNIPNPLTNDIVDTYYTDSNKNILSIVYFSDGNITKISDVNTSISPGYRITFNNDNEKNEPIKCIYINPLYIDYDIYKYKEFVDSFPVTTNRTPSSKLSLMEWASIIPSSILDLCKKNTSDLFYYNFLNYKSFANTKKIIYAPPLQFNSGGNIYATVVCSLRLINTSYTGPCVRVLLTSTSTTGIDIGFDLSTGLISQDLLTGESYEITYIYNQQYDGINNSCIGFKPLVSKPLLVKKINQGLNFFTIKWNNSIMKAETDFKNLLTKKYIKPVFTTFLNLSLGQPEKDVDTTNMTLVTYSLNSVDSVDSVDTNYYSINITNDLKTGIYCRTDINETIATPATYDPKIYIPNTIVFSNKHTVLYNNNVKQGTPSTNIKGHDNITADTYDLKWGVQNSGAEIFMSELIVFITEDVNLDSSILTKIYNDQQGVWGESVFLGNDDLRCSDIVPEACKLDKTNPICACYPSFVDKSSKNINNIIDGLTMENKDYWCTQGLCADQKAYKNPLKNNLSKCSSVCKSQVNAATNEYGNLNINDVQLNSICNNQINNQNYKYCDNDSIFNGVNCIKKKSSVLNCDNNYTSVISKDGSNQEKCIPTYNSTLICSSDSDCNNQYYCDDKYKLCLEKPSESTNTIILILIPIIILILGIIFFVLFKSYKKLEYNFLSKSSIIYFISVLIISTITCIVYYFIK